MAKNVDNGADAPISTKIINKAEFEKLINRLTKLDKESFGNSQAISSALNEAEARHNIDRIAVALVKRLLKFANHKTNPKPQRIHSFLRNFDAMRKYADLDKLAGKDMFAGETGKAAKGSKAAKANGKGAKVVNIKDQRRSSMAKKLHEPGAALAGSGGGAVQDKAASPDKS